MNIADLGVDLRLEQRYRRLVAEHTASRQALAAGPRTLPGTGTALACTQALWRFLGNQAVGRTVLVRPLVEHVRQFIAEEKPDVVLVVHDWCQLHYRRHHEKQDRRELASPWDLGYELLTSLVLSARDGRPVAPVAQALEAADGVHATYAARVQPALSHLDALRPLMRVAERTASEARCVHLLDREGNAISYLRQWAKWGRWFVVRSADHRKVQHRGSERRLDEVARRLSEEGAFRVSREVRYHGRKAFQQVAETDLRLARPGYQHRQKGGVKTRLKIPGPSLPLRLVVCRVVDADGTVLATWLLLTNVPTTVSAATLGLWYYWRWRIETYFKLLKSAGLQLEDWQQETAERVARRLLIASMACAVVWQLARDPSPEAAEARQLLIRLSGRQMKRTRPFTEPALLAGLCVLLTMFDVLEHYDLPTLARLAAHCHPRLQSPGFL